MKSRRGIALLAALWLIVAIAAIALEFMLVARERAMIGLNSADRGRHRARALGGLANMQARMEYDLRNGPATNNPLIANSQSADPWFGIDSLYSGTIYIDSLPVEIIARDLGASVNVNYASENELRLLFGFVLGNASTADYLAQTIIDWRDADDIARAAGAEAEEYLQEGRLVLPSNGLFREVDDLIYVYGMTSDLLETIRPYVNTRGTAPTRVNLNAAPEPVLRSLPGMTDVIVAQILSLRSAGRRITSIQQVITASNRGQPVFEVPGGRGGAPVLNAQQARLQATQEQLAARTVVNTTEVELTFLVSDHTTIQPTRVVAIIARAGSNANVTWQLW